MQLKKISLSLKERLWLVFGLSSLFLLGSLLFEKVSQTSPCVLCQCQRSCLWGVTFFGWLALILIFSNRSRSLALSVAIKLLKLSLFSLFCFGVFHALTHQGKIPDFCTRTQSNFVSEKDYLIYLASNPPCSKNVATLLGIPLYVFSVLWGAVGYFLIPRKRAIPKALALLICFFLPFKAFASPLDSCLQGECLANINVNLPEEDRLLLFVSFSLPDSTLKSFSRELEKYGGIFVLRGIPNNSFPDLFKKVSSLQDQGIYTPFEIDPDLFDEFVSNRVPTLALVGDKKTDRVVGNLSIRTSLEKIADAGDNKEPAKKRLEEGGACYR